MMVTLIGLDFGSTTSSAVVARARIVQERGRVEIRDVRETFRSAMAMTPFVGELLDEEAIGRLVDGWLTTAGLEWLWIALYLSGALFSAIFFTRIRFRLPYDFLLVELAAVLLGRLADRPAASDNQGRQFLA